MADLAEPQHSDATRLATGARPALSWAERTSAMLGYHGTVLKRTWKGGVFSRFLTPVLFLAAMGVGVGGLVDRSSGGVAGEPYLRWVVPGIVMASAMQWAVGESTWPVMTYIKWNQMYAAMLQGPQRVADVLRGHWLMIAFGIAWGSAVFIGIAALFGGIRSWWSLLGVPIAVVTSMAFVTPLFWIAARAENDEVFTTIFRLVVTPLILFSGTFFPIEQMPVWLQPIAWITPLWHGTELARPAFLGQPVADHWWLHVAVLAAYILLGNHFARRAFSRRLEP